MKFTNIFEGKNKKRNIILISILVLFIISQWLMVKLVYGHKINGTPARLLANIYQLKAGVIEEEGNDINILLKDFFSNKNFASKLLVAEVVNNDDLSDLDISDEEISELVWIKLLKQAWLNKIALENNILVTSEDIDDYINFNGGLSKIEELIKDYNISVQEYKDFLIELSILEAKVYNYLLANFADERGVLKIQEAYALLEVENGNNWDEVVKRYNEDQRLSANTIWLADEELIGSYEAIKEVDLGGFSKIVQVPGGYIIWHLEAIVKENNTTSREVTGLFIYAQSIEDFFNSYINSVNIKKIY